jgi:hypothetical protein
MSKPNPNSRTLTLLLKWGCEDYRHLLRFHMQFPNYLKSEMLSKGAKLSKPSFKI